MDTGIPEKTVTLGVVAICRNEERDMAGFLEGLRGWVDDIVLIDDGSRDGTARVIEQYADLPVRFICSPRTEGEYFSDQRNKGIDASTCDWLLHLDIDERILPGLAAEIRSCIARSDRDAYRFRRLNYFLHHPMRGGGWQHWNLPHLARREVLRFGGMFHETCTLSVEDERVGQLKEPIWHLNDSSYAERMRKSLQYGDELSARLARRVRHIRWYHFLFLPILEWFRKFVWQCGFRDGIAGLILAGHSACATFRACVLLWEKANAVGRKDLEDDVRAAWLRTRDEGVS